MSIENMFERRENWILPKSGTLGKKAENLLTNEAVIRESGFMLAAPSLVIPYEYYSELEGPVFYVLDFINHFFKDVKYVGVSSNSPDEDLGKRRPGMYYSAKIEHMDRTNSIYDLEKVINSYDSFHARKIRKDFGLPEKGMSLLVRPFVNATWSGSFSSYDGINLITFTNSNYGMEAMQKPPIRKVWVDKEGKSLSDTSSFDRSLITPRLFELIKNLPKIPNKGWEIEFRISGNGANDLSFYAMQTTPIEKRKRFEIKLTEKNIFEARQIVGFGEFNTNGILYVPAISDPREVIRFDSENKNYCLVTQHCNISGADSNPLGNLLMHINNASVVLDVDKKGISNIHGLAPHITSHFREEGAALAGHFTNEWKNMMLDQWEYYQADRKYLGIIYSHSKLNVSADEFEHKANVEIIGETKPFVRLQNYLRGAK